MKIQKIEIKNFRILKDVTITLEEKTTVIVGRNNSGKTCLTELFRRLLSDGTPKFTLEDFSLETYQSFWTAYEAKIEGKGDQDIRAILPAIEAKFTFNYDISNPDFGPLGDFIIDLNASSTQAAAVIKYRLRDGGLEDLLANLKCDIEKDLLKKKRLFFREIKERIPSSYIPTLWAIDPNDNTNEKALEFAQLRALVMPDFITAQRGLDDSTFKEKDVLGKILQRLLGAASSEEADAADKLTVDALKVAVEGIQEKLDGDFTNELNKLLPALSLFGYPGLGDPNIQTETSLDVQKLLGDNTKIRYSASDGISLPETYNGLGSRNLIYILFHILEFFKTFKALATEPGIHLIFIEEPEAHLHPQMQEVFIRKIHEIVDEFEKKFNEGKKWPVQFVITTHSTHIANESSFESIRYFLSSRKNGISETRIKDLRNGFTGTNQDKDKEFLHKYLTLTKCDLFFADKAIMIEGATERLLMPQMIKKADVVRKGQNLSSQYVSVIEVGGAYANKFFELLDFLELRTLIITDIDAIDSAGGSKCQVSKGTHTSNSCIKDWFDKTISPTSLKSKKPEEKTKSPKRLAYQIPEDKSKACGRSFEDAFMLTNQKAFAITGSTDEEKEKDAWDKAKAIDKTDFALKYAIEETDWNVPLYIAEGLEWLAEVPPPASAIMIPDIKPSTPKAPGTKKK